MRYQNKRLIKIVSLIVLLTFCGSELARAQGPAQISFSTKSDFDFQIPDNFELPSEMGNITAQNLAGKDSQLVVFIRDAHAIVDAQNNIAQMIAHLQGKYGIDLVALEGTMGKLDPTLFRNFPDAKTKQEVFGKYLAQGDLSGGELAAIMNPKEGKYRGIEDWPLYQANYLAYLKAYQNQPALLEQAAEAGAALEEKKEDIFDEDMKALHQTVEDFFAEKIDLLDLLKFLKEKHAIDRKLTENPDYNFPEMARLYESITFEENGDSSMIEVAVRDLAQKFKEKYERKLPKKAAIELNTAFQDFQTGKGTPAEFLKLLLKTASENTSETLLLTPSLKKMMGQAETLSSIKGTKLFDDLDGAIRNLERDTAKNEEQKELVRQFRRLRLLKNLIILEVSRDQFEEYRADASAYFDLLKDAKLLEPALQFYRFALERDHVLQENLVRVMKKEKTRAAIVVLGGFHTRGFEERLKQDGFSYAVITPKIASLEGKEVYSDMMKGKVSYKDYLRTTFYDAFARHAGTELFSRFNEVEFRKNIKLWRDEVLRQLAREGRLTEARKYTRYIDLLAKVYLERFGYSSNKPREQILADVRKELDAFRDSKIKESMEKFQTQMGLFMQGLDSLASRNELKKENINTLIKEIGASGNTGLQALRGALSADLTLEQLRFFLTLSKEDFANLKLGEIPGLGTSTAANVNMGELVGVVGDVLRDAEGRIRPEILALITPEILADAGRDAERILGPQAAASRALADTAEVSVTSQIADPLRAEITKAVRARLPAGVTVTDQEVNIIAAAVLEKAARDMGIGAPVISDSSTIDPSLRGAQATKQSQPNDSGEEIAAPPSAARDDSNLGDAVNNQNNQTVVQAASNSPLPAQVKDQKSYFDDDDEELATPSVAAVKAAVKSAEETPGERQDLAGASTLVRVAGSEKQQPVAVEEVEPLNLINPQGYLDLPQLLENLDSGRLRESKQALFSFQDVQNGNRVIDLENARAFFDLGKGVEEFELLAIGGGSFVFRHAQDATRLIKLARTEWGERAIQREIVVVETIKKTAAEKNIPYPRITEFGSRTTVGNYTAVEIVNANPQDQPLDGVSHIYLSRRLEALRQYALEVKLLMEQFGVIPGDLKPGNLLFNPRDNTITLIDLGAFRLADDKSPVVKHGVTPHYVQIQALQMLDARSQMEDTPVSPQQVAAFSMLEQLSRSVIDLIGVETVRQAFYQNVGNDNIEVRGQLHLFDTTYLRRTLENKYSTTITDAKALDYLAEAVEQAVNSRGPLARLHRFVVKTNPSAARLDQRLERGLNKLFRQLVRAIQIARDIEQTGGVQSTLDQGYKENKPTLTPTLAAALGMDLDSSTENPTDMLNRFNVAALGAEELQEFRNNLLGEWKDVIDPDSSDLAAAKSEDEILTLTGRRIASLLRLHGVLQGDEQRTPDGKSKQYFLSLTDSDARTKRVSVDELEAGKFNGSTLDDIRLLNQQAKDILTNMTEGGLRDYLSAAELDRLERNPYVGTRQTLKQLAEERKTALEAVEKSSLTNALDNDIELPTKIRDAADVRAVRAIIIEAGIRRLQTVYNVLKVSQPNTDREKTTYNRPVQEGQPGYGAQDRAVDLGELQKNPVSDTYYRLLVDLEEFAVRARIVEPFKKELRDKGLVQTGETRQEFYKAPQTGDVGYMNQLYEDTSYRKIAAHIDAFARNQVFDLTGILDAAASLGGLEDEAEETAAGALATEAVTDGSVSMADLAGSTVPDALVAGLLKGSVFQFLNTMGFNPALNSSAASRIVERAKVLAGTNEWKRSQLRQQPFRLASPETLPTAPAQLMAADAAPVNTYQLTAADEEIARDLATLPRQPLKDVIIPQTTDANARIRVPGPVFDIFRAQGINPVSFSQSDRARALIDRAIALQAASLGTTAVAGGADNPQTDNSYQALEGTEAADLWNSFLTPTKSDAVRVARLLWQAQQNDPETLGMLVTYMNAQVTAFPENMVQRNLVDKIFLDLLKEQPETLDDDTKVDYGTRRNAVAALLEQARPLFEAAVNEEDAAFEAALNQILARAADEQTVNTLADYLTIATSGENSEYDLQSLKTGSNNFGRFWQDTEHSYGKLVQAIMERVVQNLAAARVDETSRGVTFRDIQYQVNGLIQQALEIIRKRQTAAEQIRQELLQPARDLLNPNQDQGRTVINEFAVLILNNPEMNLNSLWADLNKAPGDRISLVRAEDGHLRDIYNQVMARIMRETEEQAIYRGQATPILIEGEFDLDIFNLLGRAVSAARDIAAQRDKANALADQAEAMAGEIAKALENARNEMARAQELARNAEVTAVTDIDAANQMIADALAALEAMNKFLITAAELRGRLENQLSDIGSIQVKIGEFADNALARAQAALNQANESISAVEQEGNQATLEVSQHKNSLLVAAIANEAEAAADRAQAALTRARESFAKAERFRQQAETAGKEGNLTRAGRLHVLARKQIDAANQAVGEIAIARNEARGALRRAEDVNFQIFRADAENFGKAHVDRANAALIRAQDILEGGQIDELAQIQNNLLSQLQTQETDVRQRENARAAEKQADLARQQDAIARRASDAAQETFRQANEFMSQAEALIRNPEASQTDFDQADALEARAQELLEQGNAQAIAADMAAVQAGRHADIAGRISDAGDYASPFYQDARNTANGTRINADEAQKAGRGANARIAPLLTETQQRDLARAVRQNADEAEAALESMRAPLKKANEQWRLAQDRMAEAEQFMIDGREDLALEARQRAMKALAAANKAADVAEKVRDRVEAAFDQAALVEQSTVYSTGSYGAEHLARAQRALDVFNNAVLEVNKHSQAVNNLLFQRINAFPVAKQAGIAQRAAASAEQARISAEEHFAQALLFTGTARLEAEKGNIASAQEMMKQAQAEIVAGNNAIETIENARRDAAQAVREAEIAATNNTGPHGPALLEMARNALANINTIDSLDLNRLLEDAINNWRKAQKAIQQIANAAPLQAFLDQATTDFNAVRRQTRKANDAFSAAEDLVKEAGALSAAGDTVGAQVKLDEAGNKILAGRRALDGARAAGNRVQAALQNARDLVARNDTGSIGRRLIQNLESISNQAETAFNQAIKNGNSAINARRDAMNNLRKVTEAAQRRQAAIDRLAGDDTFIARVEELITLNNLSLNEDAARYLLLNAEIRSENPELTENLGDEDIAIIVQRVLAVFREAVAKKEVEAKRIRELQAAIDEAIRNNLKELFNVIHSVRVDEGGLLQEERFTAPEMKTKLNDFVAANPDQAESLLKQANQAAEKVGKRDKKRTIEGNLIKSLTAAIIADIQKSRPAPQLEVPAITLPQEEVLVNEQVQDQGLEIAPDAPDSGVVPVAPSLRAERSNLENKEEIATPPSGPRDDKNASPPASGEVTPPQPPLTPPVIPQGSQQTANTGAVNQQQPSLQTQAQTQAQPQIIAQPAVQKPVSFWSGFWGALILNIAIGVPAFLGIWTFLGAGYMFAAMVLYAIYGIVLMGTREEEGRNNLPEAPFWKVAVMITAFVGTVIVGGAYVFVALQLLTGMTAAIAIATAILATIGALIWLVQRGEAFFDRWMYPAEEVTRYRQEQAAEEKAERDPGLVSAGMTGKEQAARQARAARNAAPNVPAAQPIASVPTDAVTPPQTLVPVNPAAPLLAPAASSNNPAVVDPAAALPQQPAALLDIAVPQVDNTVVTNTNTGNILPAADQTEPVFVGGDDDDINASALETVTSIITAAGDWSFSYSTEDSTVSTNWEQNLYTTLSPSSSLQDGFLTSTTSSARDNIVFDVNTSAVGPVGTVAGDIPLFGLGGVTDGEARRLPAGRQGMTDGAEAAALGADAADEALFNLALKRFKIAKQTLKTEDLISAEASLKRALVVLNKYLVIGEKRERVINHLRDIDNVLKSRLADAGQRKVIFQAYYDAAIELIFTVQDVDGAQRRTRRVDTGQARLFIAAPDLSSAVREIAIDYFERALGVFSQITDPSGQEESAKNAVLYKHLIHGLDRLLNLRLEGDAAVGIGTMQSWIQNQIIDEDSTDAIEDTESFAKVYGVVERTGEKIANETDFNGGFFRDAAIWLGTSLNFELQARELRREGEKQRSRVAQGQEIFPSMVAAINSDQRQVVFLGRGDLARLTAPYSAENLTALESALYTLNDWLSKYQAVADSNAELGKLRDRVLAWQKKIQGWVNDWKGRSQDEEAAEKERRLIATRNTPLFQGLVTAVIQAKGNYGWKVIAQALSVLSSRRVDPGKRIVGTPGEGTEHLEQVNKVFDTLGRAIQAVYDAQQDEAMKSTEDLKALYGDLAAYFREQAQMEKMKRVELSAENRVGSDGRVLKSGDTIVFNDRDKNFLLRIFFGKNNGRDNELIFRDETGRQVSLRNKRIVLGRLDPDGAVKADISFTVTPGTGSKLSREHAAVIRGKDGLPRIVELPATTNKGRVYVVSAAGDSSSASLGAEGDSFLDQMSNLSSQAEFAADMSFNALPADAQINRWEAWRQQTAKQLQFIRDGRISDLSDNQLLDASIVLRHVIIAAELSGVVEGGLKTEKEALRQISERLTERRQESPEIIAEMSGKLYGRAQELALVTTDTRVGRFFPAKSVPREDRKLAIVLLEEYLSLWTESELGKALPKLAGYIARLKILEGIRDLQDSGKSIDKIVKGIKWYNPSPSVGGEFDREVEGMFADQLAVFERIGTQGGNDQAAITAWVENAVAAELQAGPAERRRAQLAAAQTQLSIIPIVFKFYLALSNSGQKLIRFGGADDNYRIAWQKSPAQQFDTNDVRILWREREMLNSWKRRMFTTLLPLRGEGIPDNHLVFRIHDGIEAILAELNRVIIAQDRLRENVDAALNLKQLARRYGKAASQLIKLITAQTTEGGDLVRSDPRRYDYTVIAKAILEEEEITNPSDEDSFRVNEKAQVQVILNLLERLIDSAQTEIFDRATDAADAARHHFLVEDTDPVRKLLSDVINKSDDPDEQRTSLKYLEEILLKMQEEWRNLASKPQIGKSLLHDVPVSPDTGRRDRALKNGDIIALQNIDNGRTILSRHERNYLKVYLDGPVLRLLDLNTGKMHFFDLDEYRPSNELERREIIIGRTGSKNQVSVEPKFKPTNKDGEQINFLSRQAAAISVDTAGQVFIRTIEKESVAQDSAAAADKPRATQPDQQGQPRTWNTVFVISNIAAALGREEVVEASAFGADVTNPENQIAEIFQRVYEQERDTPWEARNFTRSLGVISIPVYVVIEQAGDRPVVRVLTEEITGDQITAAQSIERVTLRFSAWQYEYAIIRDSGEVIQRSEDEVKDSRVPLSIGYMYDARGTVDGRLTFIVDDRVVDRIGFGPSIDSQIKDIEEKVRNSAGLLEGVKGGIVEFTDGIVEVFSQAGEGGLDEPYLQTALPAEQALRELKQMTIIPINVWGQTTFLRVAPSPESAASFGADTAVPDAANILSQVLEGFDFSDMLDRRKLTPQQKEDLQAHVQNSFQETIAAEIEASADEVYEVIQAMADISKEINSEAFEQAVRDSFPQLDEVEQEILTGQLRNVLLQGASDSVMDVLQTMQPQDAERMNKLLDSLIQGIAENRALKREMRKQGLTLIISHSEDEVDLEALRAALSSFAQIYEANLVILHDPKSQPNRKDYTGHSATIRIDLNNPQKSVNAAVRLAIGGRTMFLLPTALNNVDFSAYLALFADLQSLPERAHKELVLKSMLLALHLAVELEEADATSLENLKGFLASRGVELPLTRSDPNQPYEVQLAQYFVGLMAALGADKATAVAA